MILLSPFLHITAVRLRLHVIVIEGSLPAVATLAIELYLKSIRTLLSIFQTQLAQKCFKIKQPQRGMYSLNTDVKFYNSALANDLTFC